MPMYVYEAKSGGCDRCRSPGFEIMQPLAEKKLEKCPSCGAEVIRVVQAPALGTSQTDLHYRAKRAGFKCMKRVQKGEYETLY